MTTIAYDGRTVAADSLTTFGHERGRLPTRKIVARHGRIYGADGSISLLERLIGWHAAGAEPAGAPTAKESSWSLLVVEADGRAFYVHEDTAAVVEVGAPFAIGQGSEIAVGAMAAGATARRAVEIACELSTTSGPPVVSIDVADLAMRQAAE